jgi:hypothetical protein
MGEWTCGFTFLDPGKSGVRTLPSYLFKVYFNSILASTSRSSMLSPSVRFPTEILHEILSHACYLSCPSHPSSFGDEFRLWSSSACNFIQLLLLSLRPCRIQTLVSTPCSSYCVFREREARCEVLTVTTVKFTVFWDVTSCSLVDKYLLSSNEWKVRQLIKVRRYILCKLKTSAWFSEETLRCPLFLNEYNSQGQLLITTACFAFSSFEDIVFNMGGGWTFSKKRGGRRESQIICLRT